MGGVQQLQLLIVTIGIIMFVILGRTLRLQPRIQRTLTGISAYYQMILMAL